MISDIFSSDYWPCIFNQHQTCIKLHKCRTNSRCVLHLSIQFPCTIFWFGIKDYCSLKCMKWAPDMARSTWMSLLNNMQTSKRWSRFQSQRRKVWDMVHNRRWVKPKISQPNITPLWLWCRMKCIFHTNEAAAALEFRVWTLRLFVLFGLLLVEKSTNVVISIDLRIVLGSIFKFHGYNQQISSRSGYSTYNTRTSKWIMSILFGNLSHSGRVVEILSYSTGS